MGHFTEYARAVELKPEPAVASKLVQIWNEVSVKQGTFTFTMAAVVQLVKTDIEACLREYDQPDSRGSGDEELDGYSLLNPRSEDAHKTVSGRDVEARVGVLFYLFCVHGTAAV